MGRKRKIQDTNTGERVLDFQNPSYSYNNIIEKIEAPQFGSATSEIESMNAEKIKALAAEKLKVTTFFSKLNGTSPNPNPNRNPIPSPNVFSPLSNSPNKNSPFGKSNVAKNAIPINLDDEEREKESKIKNEITEDKNKAIIEIDSDSETEPDVKDLIKRSDVKSRLKEAMHAFNEGQMPLAQISPGTNSQLVHINPWQPSVQFSRVVLQNYNEEDRLKDLEVANKAIEESAVTQDTKITVPKTYERKKRKSKSDTDKKRKLEASSPNNQLDESSPVDEFSPVDASSPVEMEESESEDFEDLWKDYSLAIEVSKAEKAEEKKEEGEEEEELEDDVCKHVFILRDDLGVVCRVCGKVEQKIETIFEYTYKKSTRTGRSYYDQPKTRQEDNKDFNFKLKLPQDDLAVAEIALHPRHNRLIKAHQMEGFKFLVKNLIAENPGGCILAHAPGSGKTFMLIAFIQSFLAKYPNARPLVILPKGILSTWKREFQRWQVEDIPLLDFYSAKAEKRADQLKILTEWQENRCILLLGYKQFSNIICDGSKSKAGTACQELLLKVPSLLILDEGHTPRNKDTNVLDSLAKIQTKRKVVLSGTLFQNHVNEVFNILNLVRPKFLKSETAHRIVNRVLSRVSIPGSRRVSKDGTDSFFSDMVEETLRSDTNFNRKIRVIQDLRELTKDVLHYYKGDFLEELPGLVDFTVMLELTPLQKEFMSKIAKYEKFKRSSVETAVYMHPRLSEIAEIDFTERSNSLLDPKMDALVEEAINIKEGVKMKFFLSVLNLAESAGEKLLAFSQYIVPLKFLERYLVHTKGWRVGKEIFVISGDSNSDEREWSMDQFNNSSDAKVLFGSIKACGEGISLVGASRVVVLDVHINPSVTRQAIGRAFRPGQTRKVFVYRLVAFRSPEVATHEASFRKELISKMWFEWSEFCRDREFEMRQLAVEESGDLFLDSLHVKEDIKALYQR